MQPRKLHTLVVVALAASVAGDGLLVRRYTELCRLYGARPRASVLSALRWDLSHIDASTDGRTFRDLDLMPLCDLLLLPEARHVTALSFRGCRLRASAAVQLAHLLLRLQCLPSIDVALCKQSTWRTCDGRGAATRAAWGMCMAQLNPPH